MKRLWKWRNSRSWTVPNFSLLPQSETLHFLSPSMCAWRMICHLTVTCEAFWTNMFHPTSPFISLTDRFLSNHDVVLWKQETKHVYEYVLLMIVNMKIYLFIEWNSSFASVFFFFFPFFQAYFTYRPTTAGSKMVRGWFNLHESKICWQSLQYSRIFLKL